MMSMNLAMTIVMGLIVGIHGYALIDMYGVKAFVSCAAFGCWLYYTLAHQRKMILDDAATSNQAPARERVG